VREDEHDRQAAHRRQTQRRSHVVAEHHERADERSQPTVKRHPVGDCRHAVLAHAVVQVTAVELVASDHAGALQRGVVRAGEIRRAADQGRHVRRQRVQDATRRLARGERGLAAKVRQQEVERARQLPPVRRGPERRQARVAESVRPALLPVLSQRGSPLGIGPEGLAGRRGDLERGQRPAQVLARPLAGVGVERAVHRRRVDRGRSEADARPAHDQVGLPIRGGGLVQRRAQSVGVVAVDLLDLPAVRLEALPDVLREAQARRSVDRDAVVVVEHDQASQTQMAGQGGRLGADPLHQVAVRGQHVGAVIDEVRAEARGQHALRERHADRVAEALSERAGGALHPGRHAVLGVTRRDRAELAEVADVVDRDGVARQVQQRVEQHRPVTRREHEAVAIGPVRGRRVVAQDLAEQHRADLGAAERHSHVADPRLAHRIGGEHADRLRRQLDRLCRERLHPVDPPVRVALQLIHVNPPTARVGGPLDVRAASLGSRRRFEVAQLPLD
jgi:hypothetical protein